MSLQFVHSHDSKKTHSDAIWQARWLSNDTIVSISSDGTAGHWEASTGASLKSLTPAHPLALTSLSVESSNSRALINSIEGTTFLWDLNDDKVVATKETFVYPGGKVPVDAAWTVSINPDGNTYASTGSSGLLKINSANPDNFGETLETISPRSEGKNKFGMYTAYDPSGKYVALSTDNGAVYVVDVEAKAVVHSFSGHATCVRSLAWSADSQLLFSASDDKRIVMYDTRNATISAPNSSVGVVASFAGHSSWVLAVDASPDGKLLASGSSDHTVKLWDIGSRACVSTLSDNSGEVWSVAWKPQAAGGGSSNALASSGEDGKLRFWRGAGGGGGGA